MFITYSLCFMTLLFVALTVLGEVELASGWRCLAGAALPLSHIYRRLRGAYGLSTLSNLIS